jgi:hypothetical protein
MTTLRRYCYPKIGRAGLGNCMLIWARAFVEARQAGAELLAPRWVQPRIGSIFRGEPVSRFYFGEFTNIGYVGGLRRMLALAAFRRIAENEPWPMSGGTAVKVIEGLKDYFTPLVPHQAAIKEEVQRIMHPKALWAQFICEEPYIAMNLRRGDQTRAGIALEQVAQYTPDDWFVGALQAIRADARWRDLPVKVVSDGSEPEMRRIVKQPGVQWVTTERAIGDIWLMSRASLLVASGYSSFSMWASFLGQMPTLYAPGKMQQKLFAADCPAFEGEWREGQALPERLK